jgi:CPA1 family monovalent cation:H+ antiporter
LPLGAAFVLGAIVSPPDAAAATAVLRKLRLPRSVVTIIEGESLINDAAALVIYNFAVAAVSTGHFSPSAALVALAGSVAGSITLGLAIGWGWSRLVERIADPLISITGSFLVAFGTYRLAERLDVSGVLAVVALGLIFARRAPRALTPDTRLNGGAVWRLVIFALNALAFVLIGLQLPLIVADLPDYSVTTLAVDGGVIALTVIMIRLTWVMVVSQLQRLVWHRSKIATVRSWREALVVGWSGMRGLISLAAALALPDTIGDGEPFPARALILFLAFSVILATLVVQGLTLGTVIRLLRVGEDGTAEAEERLARTETANAAIAALDALGESATFPRDVIDQVRMLYISRLGQLNADGMAEAPGIANAGQMDAARLAGLAAERKALLALRRRRAVGDGPLNAIQNELVLLETVLKRRRVK